MTKYENMLDIDNLPKIGRLQMDIISIAEIVEFKMMGKLIDCPRGYYYKNLLNPIMVMTDEYTARREWLVDVTNDKKGLGVDSVFENVFENLLDLIKNDYEIYNSNGKRIFTTGQLEVIKKNGNVLDNTCRLPYVGLQIVKIYIEYIINSQLAYVGSSKAEIIFRDSILKYARIDYVNEQKENEFIEELKELLELDSAISYINDCVYNLMEANNIAINATPYGWNWNLFDIELYNHYLIINKGIDFRIYEWSVREIHTVEGEEDESNI